MLKIEKMLKYNKNLIVRRILQGANLDIKRFKILRTEESMK